MLSLNFNEASTKMQDPPFCIPGSSMQYKGSRLAKTHSRPEHGERTTQEASWTTQGKFPGRSCADLAELQGHEEIWCGAGICLPRSEWTLSDGGPQLYPVPTHAYSDDSFHSGKERALRKHQFLLDDGLDCPDSNDMAHLLLITRDRKRST